MSLQESSNEVQVVRATPNLRWAVQFSTSTGKKS